MAEIQSAPGQAVRVSPAPDSSAGSAGAGVIVHAKDFLADLIPGYLDSRRREVNVLQAALAHGDFGTVRVLGHNMRGTGRGYGFDAVSDIGAALEEAAQQQDVRAIREALEALGRYLARVEVVYG